MLQRGFGRVAGMARKAGPAASSHTPMYERISRRTSGDACMARNSGVMQANPSRPGPPTANSARNSASVPTRAARRCRFSPNAWETVAVAPVHSAMPTQPMIITTGKVKAMAASGEVPSSDTNQVSARLNAVMANVPAIIGAAIWNMRRSMPPSVRS